MTSRTALPIMLSLATKERKRMKVVVIRHGESEWNLQGKIQGRQDSALTERGYRQAAALCMALAEMAITRVVTSPATRAFATATTLAQQFQCPLVKDERLYERDYGVLQGMTYEQARREFPAITTPLFSGEPKATIPQGETVHDVVARLQRSLADLYHNHSDETVAVVTHGDLLEALVWKLKGGAMEDNLRRYSHNNCGYATLAITDKGCELVNWGMGTHLLGLS